MKKSELKNMIREEILKEASDPKKIIDALRAGIKVYDKYVKAGDYNRAEEIYTKIIDIATMGNK